MTVFEVSEDIEREFRRQFSLNGNPRHDGSWVPKADGRPPNGALLGGVDKFGSPIYVGRTLRDGQYIPGKVNGDYSYQIVYYAYGGEEVTSHDYEVFCPGRTRLIWVKCSNGDIPPRALCAGTTEGGAEPLYVGRATYDGALTLGKIVRSEGCCYVSHGGQQIKFLEYEALRYVY